MYFDLLNSSFPANTVCEETRFPFENSADWISEAVAATLARFAILREFIFPSKHEQYAIFRLIDQLGIYWYYVLGRILHHPAWVGGGARQRARSKCCSSCKARYWLNQATNLIIFENVEIINCIAAGKQL